MNIDELVGENVRRARVSVGLSSHELAHRVTGVGLPLSESALSRLEAGEDRLGVDELIALGLALGMPPALLLAPLNLGSLLWVDAEGRPMASWALFHDDARSFSPPKQEGIPTGAGLALGAAPTSASPADEPPPPPPPPPLPATDEPSPAPIPITEDIAAPLLLQPSSPETVSAAPAALRLVPAEAENLARLDAEEAAPAALRLVPAEAEDPGTAAAEDGPENDPAVLPPDPAPRQKPTAGLRGDDEPSPHRDWALEALQALQMPARDP